MKDLPKAKTIAQATVVVACIVGTLLSFKIDNLLDAIILFNYPYMGSVLVPLLAALFYKNATVKGCFAAMFAGGAVGTVSFVGGLAGFLNPDMGLFIAYLVGLVVLVIVSSMDPKKCPMVDHKAHKV